MMDQPQSEVPPPPPRPPPRTNSAIRQNPPPPPPRPRRQLGQRQSTSSNTNALNQKMMRLFLVLTASCVFILLSGTSSTKSLLNNISAMHETVMQKIDTYQLVVEPTASAIDINKSSVSPNRHDRSTTNLRSLDPKSRFCLVHISKCAGASFNKVMKDLKLDFFKGA